MIPPKPVAPNRLDEGRHADKDRVVSEPQITPAIDPDMTAARESLRRQLQTKVEQNRAHMAKLHKDSKRVPLLALLFLLTIPAGIFWGFAGVLLVIFCTVLCLGSATYLVWGHKEEYRQRIAAAQSELRTL